MFTAFGMDIFADVAYLHMGGPPKIGFFTPQIIPFVHRDFHYFHHPFWGKTPYFWKHPSIHNISSKEV